MIATLLWVSSDDQGAGLSVAAAMSDTTLTVDVDGPFPFEEGGGLLSLDGVTLTYASADDDARIITLAVPLVAASDLGTPVLPLAANGQQQIVKYATVDWNDDGDGHSYVIDSGDADSFRDGDEQAGLQVLVEATKDGDVVRSLVAVGSNLDPGAVVNPLYIGVLVAPVAIPSNLAYQTVTGWFSAEQRGGMIYDPSTGLVRVPIDGYYAVSSSAVMFDSSSTTGRRAARPSFSTYGFGVIAGGENNQDGVARRHTVPLVSPLKPLKAGESVSLEVSQTSGASMNLFGDAGGNSTFFCIEYRGPLVSN